MDRENSSLALSLSLSGTRLDLKIQGAYALRLDSSYKNLRCVQGGTGPYKLSQPVE